MEYSAENFEEITRALQSELEDRSPSDAYDYSVREKASGMAVLTLDHLAGGMNSNVDSFKETGKLAAFKLGIARVLQKEVRKGFFFRSDGKKSSFGNHARER